MGQPDTFTGWPLYELSLWALVLAVFALRGARDERGHQPEGTAEHQRSPLAGNSRKMRDQHDRRGHEQGDGELHPAGKRSDIERPTSTSPTVNASCHPSP